MRSGAPTSPLPGRRRWRGARPRRSSRSSPSPGRPVTYACDNDRRPPLKQQARGGRRSAERGGVQLGPLKRRRKTHKSSAFHTKSTAVVKSISHYL